MTETGSAAWWGPLRRRDEVVEIPDRACTLGNNQAGSNPARSTDTQNGMRLLCPFAGAEASEVAKANWGAVTDGESAIILDRRRGVNHAGVEQKDRARSVSAIFAAH